MAAPGGLKNTKLSDELEGVSEEELGADIEEFDEDQQEADKLVMIDLWRKLQDLLKIQTQEETQDAREKIKKQRTKKLRYYKVTLTKDELDKFSPKKDLNDLTVDLLFAT